ncbi:DUF4087 domain-containing protein [Ancylobacter dichloromethanicus]|uniref:DUF4087 domain-containing protein n=1 Tax=Ancylobacter dichloromethanicus TaxID=518825 RepID=A0A9W6MYQ7_9HYPH|nr:DUF4087 domain-containing protein [Ancylobacter dichloromethanicus]MBS7554084.1 DUF4087 domain-containing protein [Ancylobacter dichloromethanicus]GLK71200.1 hypothetical protein GCM10017643_13150 [Ancylobacter dichloromethanicus]
MMRRSFLTLLGLAVVSLAALPAGAAENRCGWYVNPTPGNWYLSDRDGDWWMRSQGGMEAEGFENAPDFDTRQYVKLQPNGYGYGCACLSVDTDKAKMNISRIYSGTILPLSRCRNDKALDKPD